MADTRDLLVRIKGDSSDFEKSMNRVKGGSDSAGLSFGKLTGAVALGNIVADVAKKGFDFLSGQLMDTVKSAQASENAISQLNAVIKSTGGAAGFTSKALQDQATALQKMTTFSDEAVMSAQSLLLTFTNVKGQVFKDSVPLILDMSQALGQDLKSSSIQLGKALNDPIKGITALSRVGVSFTAQQKDMIAKMVQAGNVAGAQQVILAELRKEFGGSAEAAGKTFAGSLERLKNQLDDVKESIGGAIIRGVTPFAQKLAEFVSSDRFHEWAQQTVAIIGKLFDMFGQAISAVVSFAEKTKAYLTPQLQELTKHVQGDLWPALQRLWKEALEPLAKVVLPLLVESLKYTIEAITLLVEALAFVINKLLDFVKWIEAVPGKIKQAWNDIDSWFKAKWDSVVGVFDNAKKSIEGHWHDLTDTFEKGKGKLTSTFQAMTDALKPWREHFGSTFVKTMQDAAKAMEKYDIDTLTKWGDSLSKILDATAKWGSGLYESVKTSVTKSFDQLGDYLVALPDRFTTWLAKTGEAIKLWGDTTYHNITSSITNAFDNVGKTLQEFPGKAAQAFENFKQTIINFFTNLGTSIKDWVSNSGKEVASHHTDGMKSHFTSMDTIRKVGDAVIGMILLVAATVVIYFVDAGIRLIKAFASGIASAIGSAVGAAGNAAQSVVNRLGQFAGSLYDAGRNMIQGFINGIKDMVGGVVGAAGNVGSSAVNKMKSVLGIHSPSKVFQDIGVNMGQGLIDGLSGTMSDVQGAVSSLASPTVEVAQASAATTVQTASQTAAPQAQQVHITVAPQIGLYAGMPAERREIATQLWQDLVKMARAQGVQLPNINVAGIQ